jgi:Fic family protein
LEREKTGTYETVSTVAGEVVRAFVPAPLPPVPPVEWGAELREAFDRALLALGRLDSATALLPDTQLFLYAYVRKEAVLSSQIEGTQSSLSDLLLYELDEMPGVPLDDVVEVSNYVAALEHGLKRVREGFPICNRLLCEVQGVLLSKGRGANKQPGEFRRSQNWIGTRPGNASYVPPPANRVADCMAALERFIHDDPVRTSTLVKAALAHVQFETIHPFLDGNGRVGRLLITLLLCVEGVLAEPLLYLSLYRKQHRQRYYELLGATRSRGDWESWLAFFAEAVAETAAGAVETAQAIAQLFRADREKLAGLGRSASSAMRVHHALQSRPLCSIASMSASLALSVPTVTKALESLERTGIVREITRRQRGRLFVYDAYLALLNRGTEATAVPPRATG